MTSQRFLNDKVNSSDFLRSLKDACIAPIIAFFAISFYYIGPIVTFAKELKKNLEYIELLKKHEIISYFGGLVQEGGYYEVKPITIIMIGCGILMAISLFSFAFKKNSVNVYFSMGITRTRLFVNRIAAGALEILAVSVIPFLIVFIANISLFGYHSHQLTLFAYYSFLMFTSGMAGLTIGALAASVSGSRIEMMFTTASLSTIVMAAAALFYVIKCTFLRGYVNIDGLSKALHFSPWTGISEAELVNRLITGKTVPKELLITWKADVLPLVLWIVASVVIFALGMYLFKKRKNENTNSFGKFDISSAVNGAMIFFIGTIVMAALCEDLYMDKINSIALCILFCTVGSFAIFFVAELIIRRNFKAALRMLTVYGGLALVSFGALIVIGTGYFGTYNKLPEAKDIDFVSMSYSDPLNSFTYITPFYRPEEYNDEKKSNIVCKSNSPEDIKLCIEQFNKIKKDKRLKTGTVDYVSFVIKTKDGKFISRNFPVYSEEILHDYDKSVFNSDYFHEILRKNLLNSNAVELEENDTAEPEENDIYYGDVDKYYNSVEEFYYFNGSLLSDSFDYYDYRFDKAEELSLPLTEELKTALYNDLCKMTYDEYYGKNGEPVGAVVNNTNKLMLETAKYSLEYEWLNFDSFDYYDITDTKRDDMVKTGVAYSGILVYPQMTETLEQLKGIEPNPHNTAVKAVLCPDQKLTLSNALNNVQGYNYFEKSGYGVFISGMDEADGYYWVTGKKIVSIFSGKPQGTYLDFIEIIYNENGVKLTRIDDADNAKKVTDAARAVYDTYNDNGRYVYVIYEDGCVVTKYLPEKSLSVLN